MKQLFARMEQELIAGHSLVLATVVATSGATPRGAGARMLVGSQGRICGTIGGGAMEHRAEVLALQVLEQKNSVEQVFSLNKDDVQNLGMVCGGNAQVFFCHISAQDASVLPVVRHAQELLEASVDFWLLSDLAQGGEMQLYTKADAPQWLLPHLTREPQWVRTETQNFYVEQLGVAGHVYLFGGGHVAQELEPVLSHLGFRCVVVDDRPEFANRKLFPTAEQVLCADFSGLDSVFSVGPADYVCIMTRGHAHDTEVAAQLLPKRPRYIGMIGSRRKHAVVCQTLREEYGFSDDEIAAIVSPIGLSIQAETPAEIAISIAAQMIAVRASV